MKYLLLIAFMAVATLSFAQDVPVKFQVLKHSFGKIKKDVPVTTEFKFTNTSSKPLIIDVATAECGCTTPDYPKNPIMAGKASAIKVTYNAANEGHFEKKVTVKFAKYDQPIILEIDGDVEGGK